ncbi:DUF4176 domain-containing protein [Streptococcus oricebi]|uniref:DUF4176 domain-containing protein n=1 Tax=Streptococcus oricebi TaxID=1547447 RepID=A0ABS5B5N8_9STRE|nr:DUF4176 domain-containing protein [Streptococcus oricebi]MBP2624065.1 hypothetical protein [Streptococcus oricebi]
MIKVDNLLPVGTVVKVKGSDDNFVIASELPLAELNGEKGYFDFGAASLPSGFTGENFLFFNKEDVTEIVFLGYVDLAFQELLQKYDKVIAEKGYRKFTVAEFNEKAAQSGKKTD